MELFDLYTPERVKNGRIMKRGDPLPDGCWRMVVRIAIFSDEGKMLIQKRQPTKLWMPGKWDMSAAGSVIMGEDSHTAILRETREELGLELAEKDIRAVTTMFIHGRNGSGIFEDIYTAGLSPELDKLKLQAEEVEAVRWADEDEILSLIKSGDFIRFRPEFIRLLFAMGNGGRGHIL